MAIKKIADYAPAEKVNPYIAELADVKVGETFEETVVTKLNAEGKLRGVDGVRQNIQSAARANGFTARLVETEVLSEPTADETGETRLVFTAFAMQKSPERKPKP